MKVIGIAGGIASGKSLVAAELERLGALRLDADRAGHEVLRLDHVRAAIRARWGDSVFDDQGQVIRSALAKIVFAGGQQAAAELTALEAITHPEIGQRLRAQLDEWRRQEAAPAVVLDAPVMFKAGWDALCDSIWFVDAPDDARLVRARARGWSEADFRARELSQASLHSKRALADIVLDNSGSIDHLIVQVRQAWHQLGLFHASLTAAPAAASPEFLSNPT